MISDPIADMLIRIKNGYMAKKKTVNISLSRFNTSLSNLLVKTGYINSCEIDKENRVLKIGLKYDSDTPVVTEIIRVSKPGLRVYVRKQKLPRVLGGLGIAIISTPKGLMTEKEARKQNLGGEIICKIW